MFLDLHTCIVRSLYGAFILSRCFRSIAPTLWNQWPECIRKVDTLSSLMRNLKTLSNLLRNLIASLLLSYNRLGFYLMPSVVLIFSLIVDALYIVLGTQNLLSSDMINIVALLVVYYLP